MTVYDQNFQTRPSEDNNPLAKYRETYVYILGSLHPAERSTSTTQGGLRPYCLLGEPSLPDAET